MDHKVKNACHRLALINVFIQFVWGSQPATFDFQIACSAFSNGGGGWGIYKLNETNGVI